MRTKKFGAAFAAAAVTVGVLTGCQSGTGDAVATPQGIQKAEAARQVVAAATAVPSADDLGPAIAVESLRGKTIYSIPIDSKAEFYQAGEQAMKSIAAKAGINYVTFPSDGTQISYQQGINQAINARAGAILLNGPLPSTLGPQIDAANKAGVPIVPLHISDKDSPATPGVRYESFAPFNEAARLMALAATAAQEGKPVHALVIESSETGPSQGMVDTIRNTLAEQAPEGSRTTVINIAVPQWAQQIQGQVQSAVLRNPDINAVLPIFDSMSLYAAPGIRQAAYNRDVPIYTFNGTPSILAMVENEQVAMNVAENPDWVAYVNLDAAFRAMLGVEPVPGASGPVRVIDASNVAETGDPPTSGQGFGDEYAGAFLRLWGLA
ncbi:substrate-binding domain-containing protein [Nocardia sp. NPDC019395]|uniref:sugar ABC transporter substrate-binding protein n=1 Tax=Nocardia sp. NPDC019395 TaxID=3154686 RepID=UPI0033E8BC6A